MPQAENLTVETLRRVIKHHGRREYVYGGVCPTCDFVQISIGFARVNCASCGEGLTLTPLKVTK